MEKAYQMPNEHDTVVVTATKLTVVWSGVVAGMADWDWGTVAAVLASIYTGMLIMERASRWIIAFLSRGAK